VNVVPTDSPRCAAPLLGVSEAKWSRRHTLIVVDAHHSFEFGMSSNEMVREKKRAARRAPWFEEKEACRRTGQISVETF
jgi:hypothetical protein